MNNYFRARPRAVALAWVGTLLVLLFDLWLALQGTPRVLLVDGWAVLDRIMLFENGAVGLGRFLFEPHGAHLHAAAFAPAWLDFHFAGGQQKLTQAMSLGATTVFCALFVWIMIREGVRTHTPALLLGLGCTAAVAVMSGLSDQETMFHPFQVVLSLARMSYAILLFAIIKGLVESRLGMYIAAMLASMLAVTFHGTGYVFAICVILAHLLVCRRLWMLAFSALPLLTAVLVQSHYSPGGDELSHFGSVLGLRTLREVIPGVSAFFVAPVWPLFNVIGMIPLLTVGFVLFCLVTGLTVKACMSILNVRLGPPIQMGRALLAPRSGPTTDSVTAFFAILGIFLLASAFAATLFWLIRTDGTAFTSPPYYYVLTSRRYGAFGCLSYVIVIVALYRARFAASSVQMATYTGPVTALVCALLLGFGLYASVLSLRGYELDNDLNIAAAGLAVGLSPVQPEAEAVWPGANTDPHWLHELPLTNKYLKAVHKGFWQNLPPLGAQGGAYYAGYPIVGLQRTLVTSDSAPGRCAISGTLPEGNTEFSSKSLLLPVAGSNGVVVGYAGLLRNRGGDGPRIIRGFVQCPAGATDSTPLFLAHDIKPVSNMTDHASTDWARGSGAQPILPVTEVTGSLSCERAPGATAQGGDTVLLKLNNGSSFDWNLDAGRFPLRIGVHLVDSKGAMVRFDDRTRVPAASVSVPSHGQAVIRFPLSKVSVAGIAPERGALTAQFELLQEGHVWFANMHCDVPLGH